MGSGPNMLFGTFPGRPAFRGNQVAHLHRAGNQPFNLGRARRRPHGHRGPREFDALLGERRRRAWSSSEENADACRRGGKQARLLAALTGVGYGRYPREACRRRPRRRAAFDGVAPMRRTVVFDLIGIGGVPSSNGIAQHGAKLSVTLYVPLPTHGFTAGFATFVIEQNPFPPSR
jgi:hypothetical protein